jgi:hypothetical protein
MAPVTWRRDQSVPPVFTIEGVIDEQAPLTDLVSEITGPAVLDLRNVRRISSAGTRNWLTLMRAVKGHKIVLRACSRALVEQMNMLLDFTGGAKVESIFAPFQCPACERTENTLYQISELRQQLIHKTLKRPSCSSCDRPMELTEDQEGYFQFLRYVDTGR